MDPSPAELPLVDFATAMAIGALVGIDRERRKANAETASEPGGIRTFILLAEAGAVAAWLALQLQSVWVFAAAAVVVGGLVIAGYLAYTLKHDDSYGLTSEVAAIVVFWLGALVVSGHRELAVILGIITSAVLAYKRPLHGLVARLNEEDVYAGLKLLIATFIVLPFLPDQYVDPWKAINPSKLWTLVIMISALSLAGYAATRVVGAHQGTALTGFFGGLASSTAVTLALARQSKEERALPNTLAAGLLIAWTVMFLRVAAEVAFVHPALLWPLAAPLATMGVVCLGAAGLFYFWSQADQGIAADSIPLKNPFSLTSAIKFAVVFGVVLLAVKLVQTNFPGQGLYAVAALAGLTDVDAITLSMAQYAQGAAAADAGAAATQTQGAQLEAAASGADAMAIAAVSIIIAAMTNTLVKCGLVLSLGSWALAVRVMAATGAIVVGGAAAMLITALTGV